MMISRCVKWSALSAGTVIMSSRDHLSDLILSDVLMPEGDGATLLRDIRRDPELKSTQVVLMTGSPDMVTPHKDMEEWPDDFLLKPVGLQRLLSCVQARVSVAPQILRNQLSNIEFPLHILHLEDLGMLKPSSLSKPQAMRSAGQVLAHAHFPCKPDPFIRLDVRVRTQIMEKSICCRLRADCI
jgi:CheY-like chemotaxis protein